MFACPFGIPRYEWHKARPLVRKCWMCYERIRTGRQPVCVEVCPEKVCLFGERSVLLAEARRRIHANPDRYINHIYGEHEVGGTGILYISDVPLEGVIFDPKLGDKPLPTLTAGWMRGVPKVAAGVAVAMSAIWWIIERRMRLAREQADKRRTAENEQK